MKHSTRKKRKQNRKKEAISLGGFQTDKCIFINMMQNEGLGNQLFTYASGLLAKKVTGLPLCIIPVKGNPHSKNNYTSLFNGTVVDDIKEKQRIMEAKSIIKDPRKNAANGVVGRWNNVNIDYNKNMNKGRNVKLPDILYHNYKGIESILPEVKESLVRNEFHKQKYLDLKERYQIDSSKSAFIHVRRGDYVSRDWALQPSYYNVGLTKLRENQAIQKVYVFSNDIYWCKNHDLEWKKHFDREITYVDNIDELETLYCMMICEAGAIISNSTFSSWGVMIGADTNASSTIVYPSPWIDKAPKNYKNPFSFPERWIAVDNENIK